jgi:hypothetical protein
LLFLIRCRLTENTSRMQMSRKLLLFVCFSCCLVHQSAWLMTKANKVKTIYTELLKRCSVFSFCFTFRKEDERSRFKWTRLWLVGIGV